MSLGLEVILSFGQLPALYENYIPDNTVLVVPSDDTWPAFGRYVGVDFLIQVRFAKQPIRASGFIGFIEPEGRQNANVLIEQLVAGGGSETAHVMSEQVPRFFTMLPDMEAYRRLVQQLGSDDATAVLTAVNDLVALNEFDSSIPRSGPCDPDRSLHPGIYACSDTFFAFKNAGPLLRGLSNEKIGMLSSNLAIKLQLPGRKNEHDLKFNFDHNAELPKRMAVIIGKNGVGKSQTLGRIAKAALGKALMVLNDGTVGRRPLINRLAWLSHRQMRRSLSFRWTAKAPTDLVSAIFDEPVAAVKAKRIRLRSYRAGRPFSADHRG